MIRVLLADQEIENRRNFKVYIQSNYPDFRVVKEVDSGLQTILELESSDIDLVIADMKLAELTGYQVFEKVRATYPKVQMILYATYDEHIYMEKAMEDGLAAYMYKPVKPVELGRCLTQAKQRVEAVWKQEQEKALLESQYEQRLSVFEDRFLINLVHGHMEDPEEIEQGFQYFRMPLKTGYTVMVLKVDHFQKIRLTLDEKEKQLFIFGILKKAENVLSELQNGIAFINHFDEIAMILGDGLENDRIMEIGQEIKQRVHNESKATVTIGVGKTYNNPSEINISYKQAKAALRYRSLLGENTVIPIQYVEKDNHVTYRYPLKKEELLVYKVVIGDQKNVLKLLAEIFEALKGCGPLPDKLLPKIILDILVSINRYASEQMILLDAEFARYISIRDISQKNTWEEAYAYLQDVLQRICQYVIELRERRNEEIFEEAKKYADVYYFENISLSKVAAHVQCTPEYVNTLFLQRGQQSFYTYSVQVRMNKAKELMHTTDLDDGEIAVKVGYKDPKYFAKVFFQIERVSTIDFRNRKEKRNFV